MATLRVILALGPLALSFIRDNRRWLWWGKGIQRTRDFHQRRADRLLRAITTLGPSFVKVAQVFASRADLIPEPYISRLATLVDAVPPMPFADVERTILEAYGRPVDEVFDAFERAPVAAASLAQVHRARVNGETVAVKVLRPDVERRMAIDIRSLRRILEALDRWWGHPHIKRELTALSAFEKRVREEVDFRLEAGYATRIRNNFAGNDSVRIPRVHDEFTRERVLVLEFMEGTRIDRLDPSTVDVRRIVQTLVELYIQMELIDGLFHADPHPGNVMVAPDGTIVLVDFGAVVTVPMAMRRALVHTSIAAVRRDVDGVTEGFTTLNLIPPGTPASKVRWIAQLMIENAYSNKTAKERIDTLLADRVMKTLFDSPITLTEEAVYFARAAALIEGIGTRYDPVFQIVPIASPVVLRMRSRILRSLGETVTPTVDEIATVAGYALGTAARWVTDRVAAWRKPSDGNDKNGHAKNGNAKHALTTVALLFTVLATQACGGRIAVSVAPAPAPTSSAPPPIIAAPLPALVTIDARCDSCGPVAMAPELAHAIEARIAQLRDRGGDCRAYGSVLERSYQSGLITLRPFMWRVGEHLASGSAHPSGVLAVAVDIDSLNVGARTLDDVVRSIEHEAAHVAFVLPSADPVSETVVEQHISGCRAATRE